MEWVLTLILYHPMIWQGSQYPISSDIFLAINYEVCNWLASNQSRQHILRLTNMMIFVNQPENGNPWVPRVPCYRL